MNNLKSVENLSSVERVSRVAVGAALIMYPMTVLAGPLGWQALLPLLAIIPIVSGLFAFCPLKHAMQNPRYATPRQQNGCTVTRLAYGVTGSVLIASVFIVQNGPLGWLAVLPLLGIYPTFAGLTGETLLRGMFRASQQIPEQVTRTPAKTLRISPKQDEQLPLDEAA